MIKYRYLPLLLLLALSMPGSVLAQAPACGECYQQQRPRCDASCQGSVTREAFSNCANSCVHSACAQTCRPDAGGSAPSRGERSPIDSFGFDRKQPGGTQTQGKQQSGRGGTASQPKSGYSAPSATSGYEDSPLSPGFTDADSNFEDERDVTPCGDCMSRKMHGECQNECAAMDLEDLNACRQRCAKARCANICSLPGKITKEPPRFTGRDCAHCKRAETTGCRSVCGQDPDRPGFTACVVSCIQDRCLEKCNPEPE